MRACARSIPTASAISAEGRGLGTQIVEGERGIAVFVSREYLRTLG
jgi:hypothetical protein